VGLVTILTSLSDSTGGSRTLNEAGRWSTGGVRTLGAALDGQSMAVGELNLYILLFDAWKFPMEFIATLVFLNVELRSEALQLRASGTIRATAVLVEVVKKTEQRMEGGIGRGDES